MPVIKVWCLPPMGETELNALHKTIVTAAMSVEELGIRGEDDITCLFPTGMMAYGLGTEVIIEVTGLFVKPERTEEIRKFLANALVLAVGAHCHRADLIECFIYPFDQKQGYASFRRDIIIMRSCP